MLGEDMVLWGGESVEVCTDFGVWRMEGGKYIFGLAVEDILFTNVLMGTFWKAQQ